MINRFDAKKINIDSDIFADLREHFNVVLQRTLSNMQTKGCDSAGITVKLAINVEQYAETYTDTGGKPQKRWYQKPSIAHKVSATMKINDTEEGFFKEDYELFYDDVRKEFVLLPIVDRQERMMFDEDVDD